MSCQRDAFEVNGELKYIWMYFSSDCVFLDAISISTVGCVTQVTSQAISDLERV